MKLRNCLLMGLAAACLLAGCGKGDRPELGYVSGKVTMDDKPMADVWVMFNPQGGGRTSIGRTDQDGEYELMYLEGAKGANFGTHKVVIVTFNEDEAEEMRSSTGEPIKEPIPAQYNTQTTLTAEVKEGDQVIDFALKSTP
jgi:hypothetical protein